MNPVKTWIKAMRAPFFQASIIPVLVGTSVAYREGPVDLLKMLLAIIATPLINAGVNLANDYYDHRSGTDVINRFPTPFSGGSRVIQKGLIPPERMLAASFVCFAGAAVIGAYLVAVSGWPLVVLGIVGILLGFFYTADPLKLGYRGVGELICGVLLGPLAVMGAYFVQRRHFSLDPLLVSIPIGILVALILYINEFPDYEADRAAGKKHIIVLIGTEKASKALPWIMVILYMTIFLMSVTRVVPIFCLICLATLPVALKIVRTVSAFHDHPLKLIPAQAATIFLHLIIGVIITASLFIAGELSI